MRLSLISFLLSFAIANADDSVDTICIPSDCTGSGAAKQCVLNFKVDYSASELGYYTVDGCDGVQPTLGLEKDVTYYFYQEDTSNYYHPLGWAYYTDGAHADVDELEPSIVPPNSASTCGDTNICPAPMYKRDDTYLGVYSNNVMIAPLTGDEDFGLDVYEPEFFATSVAWTEAGVYNVALKFDVDDFIDDIFYFCHIHAGMSGRIKWVDGTGTPLQAENTPELDYEYETPSEFDEGCGTYGIGDYQLPHAECPNDFVCDSNSPFAQCVEAMNCRMTAGMTTNMHAGSAKALFIHQMIPHHRNAVNMAKALLASGEIDCENYTDETADCILLQIASEIIPVQNHQIQAMQGVLEELNYDDEDDCKVDIGTKGPFQIVNKKSGKCITHSKLLKNGRARSEECGSEDGQTWMITNSGLIKNVDSENCMFAKGSKIKVGNCSEVQSRMVYMGGDGSLAMSKDGSLMVVTPAPTGSTLQLKPRNGSSDRQEYDFVNV